MVSQINKSLFIFFFICEITTGYPQKISMKEFLEQPSNAILIENFYQIKLDDFNSFTSNSTAGFTENDRCYIQNFQSETGLKGQLILQFDFSGKAQYIGISKVFIDKSKKSLKPKSILINDLENCYFSIMSNWNIANCMAKKIILYISD